VVLVYLFGSYLNRNSGQFHDIDIAVFANPDNLEVLDREMPYGYGAFLCTELAHILKCNLVDVVLLNYASPLLTHRVIDTGRLIYCRSETDRVRFEVTSLKRYADTAYIRKIKRLYMKQRIEKGLAAYA
jgi:predicted nucleotidyltransferase